MTETKENTLGILVRSDQHMDYLISFTEAANSRGKAVRIFFTGKGVLLTQDSRWEQLVGNATLTVCDVSFRSNNLTGDVTGLVCKDFATQARNAEMVAECNRYIVL